MNFPRVSSLTKKEQKKLLREPAALFLIILFPIALTLAFGVSFGAVGGTSATTYQVGVINADVSPNHSWSQHFVANLAASQILKVTMYTDEAAAHADLAQGKIQALIVIPANFGISCDSFAAAPSDATRWIATSIPLYCDSGSMFATQAIPPLLEQALATTLSGAHTAAVALPVQIESPSLVQATERSAFDYMVPGIFAYAVIFLTMTVAQSFTVDREKGLLRRIGITPTTPTEFMTSQSVANMGIAVVQVALVFAVAFAVGFRPNAAVPGLVLAFGIVAIFALCNVGFGLITATVAKSPGSATGIAFLFILPQMFLGTFVAAASSGVQAAAKFVPSYYVTDALTSLLLRGAPVTSPLVLKDIAVVVGFSFVALVVGVVLFRRYGNA
ncbi:MAG: ABC transporter permease [Halobacteriota archaeon]|jgi:ABC-2 type transport system permease protein